MSVDVPGARLHRPSRRTGCVPRSRLVDRLLRAADVRVVALTAGAGAGKTTLLAQWAQRDDRAFAWVTLDGTDGDPAALVSDLTLAMELADPGAGRGPLPAAGAPEGPLSRTWRWLMSRTRPFVLVLDDAHVLRNRASLALVAAIVDRLPPGAQLAIAARGTPALPLARWSVQGDLLRIQTEDLAMTRSEAELLMRAAGVELAPGELDTLLDRTEGWAAGLCMAALRLRGRAGPERVAGFTGDDRLAADYLRDEVLAPLPADLVRFLTDTSILPRLCGQLCDSVLGRTGSGMVLRDLERLSQFVLPVAGQEGWYRCHRMLAGMLRAELHVRDPGLAPALHRRASAWHEASGDPVQAIQHARLAGDLRRAGELAWARLLPRLLQGDVHPLQQVMEGFGEDELAAQPTLALAAAWCRLERGDPAGAKRWALVADRGSCRGPLPGGPGSLGAASAILRAHEAGAGLTRMAEDIAVAGGAGGLAGAWLPVCCLLEGVTWRLRGDADRSRALLTAGEQFASAPLAPASLVQCLSQLCLLAIDDGDWEQAAALAARARTLGERERLQDHGSMLGTYAVSSLVGARTGRPADATGDARRALRLLGAPAHVPPWLAVEARIVLARGCLLVGDASSSRALLREARRVLSRVPDAGVLGARLEETWRKAEAFRMAGVIAPARLSRAELRILRFLPTHLSYREIGERLHVSRCTVKSQALSAYRKLDVSSRSQAVERAGTLGLIHATDAPAT